MVESLTTIMPSESECHFDVNFCSWISPSSLTCEHNSLTPMGPMSVVSQVAQNMDDLLGHKQSPKDELATMSPVSGGMLDTVPSGRTTNITTSVSDMKALHTPHMSVVNKAATLGCP